MSLGPTLHLPESVTRIVNPKPSTHSRNTSLAVIKGFVPYKLSRESAASVTGTAGSKSASKISQ